MIIAAAAAAALHWTPIQLPTTVIAGELGANAVLDTMKSPFARTVTGGPAALRKANKHLLRSFHTPHGRSRHLFVRVGQYSSADFGLPSLVCGFVLGTGTDLYRWSTGIPRRDQKESALRGNSGTLHGIPARNMGSFTLTTATG